MNTKLKCLLLDDELPGLTYLKMLCEQLSEIEVIKAYNCPITFLSEVPKIDFDLCILDIEMPQMNGLQVANLLKEKLVIFTTAYKEYAADAFDLNAVDYVRKPVALERLKLAVQKATKRYMDKNTTKSHMVVNTDKGKALIVFDQICYIKNADIESRDKVAYLANNIILTLKNISFEKLQMILPENDFCRINKREMVALKSVQIFSFDEITTNIIDKSGKNMTFSLSENYRKEFIKKLEF